MAAFSKFCACFFCVSVGVMLPCVTLSQTLAANPASLAFSTPYGETSSGQPVTLTASGGTVTLGSITITGPNASDFAISSNTCGSSVSPGTPCTVVVTFTPPSISSFTATLNIPNSASGSPQAVPLTGIGAPAQTTLDPAQCLTTTAPTPNFCTLVTGSDIGAYINAAAQYLTVGSGGACIGTGGVIQLPTGTWNVITPIVFPCGGIELRGAGSGTNTGSPFTPSVAATPGATVLEGIKLGKSVVAITGTISSPISNVHIDNLSITNGTPSTNPGAAPNTGTWGISCSFCNNLEIDHVYVTSIQGEYGIIAFDSSNVRIHDNSVTQFGMGGIMNEVKSATSSNNIWIERNYVDGCTNTTPGSGSSYSYCYGISVSAQGSTGNPNTVNGWVLNNVVADIPLWECYDSHGGTNQTFEGNSCANSTIGIMAGVVSGGALKHVVIRRNHLVAGTASSPLYGIVLAGVSVAYPVSDATIDSNYVDGYGSSVASNLGQVGAINIMSTQDVLVTNNECPTYNQACIVLYVTNLNTTITGNRGGSIIAAASGSAAASAEISVVSAGSWGMYVDNNISGPSSQPPPLALFYDSSSATQVNFGPNNRLYGPSTTTITGTSVPTQLVAGGSYPAALAVSPTAANKLSYQSGTVGYDLLFRPAYIFSSPGTSANYAGGGGFYSTDTEAIAYGAISTSTPDTVTQLAGGASAGVESAWLPIGMNITIAGAGGSPTSNLNARVIGNNGIEVFLDGFATSTPTASVLSGTVLSVSGSPVGSLGQYCGLTNFNYSSTATAQVYFNASGSLVHQPLVVTSAGSGATAAPTSANLTSGSSSATCPTTATVTLSTIVGGEITYQAGQINPAP